MLRQRLVRQSAVNSSGSSSSVDCNPPKSCIAGTFRQLSSESLDNLIDLSPIGGKTTGGRRRHSVACGTVFIDGHKNALKSVFNTAVRRMSNACSFLPFQSSSQPAISSTTMNNSSKNEEKVVIPSALNTFRQNVTPSPVCDTPIDINRRFSSDFPPPTYQEATKLHKKFCTPDEAAAFKESLFKRETETIESASEDSQDSIVSD